MYATSLIYNRKKLYSVTNIGYSPTLKNTHIKEIETYIFDFNENLYDKDVEIFFHKKIRDEIFFSKVSDLINRINLDIKFAKKYFKIEK